MSEEEFNNIFSEHIIEMNKLSEREKELYINEYHNYFDFNYIDELGRDWDSLSNGEKSFFALFLNIYYFNMTAKEHEHKMLITLDEYELSLHPNWQKKYLYELINLLNSLHNNFHVIFTSHSPFIISDLPNENVIFLKDGKQEYPFKDKQTFGANIHTLLSDGFFMSDGLMGDFAKSKIEEIKKFYDENKDLKKEDVNFNTQKIDYESKKEKFNHIQSIIGEPFLQTVIKNYLDELELIFLDKDAIDLELSKIEERKLYLEKLKNAKN